MKFKKRYKIICKIYEKYVIFKNLYIDIYLYIIYGNE